LAGPQSHDETIAMARPVVSALLTPDELKRLAEIHIALAMQTEGGPERLSLLTFADTLIDLAETKKLLLRYERRLLN
jgi:hypothetical protein